MASKSNIDEPAMNRITDESRENRLSYRKEKLANLPALQLPTDRPRSSARELPGSRHSVSFSRTIADGLRELASREGSTLSVTLLSALYVLLLRYTGQEDIVVGLQVPGPDSIQPLPLHANLSGDPSFLELLGRVRAVALDAQAHEDFRLQESVEELQSGSDLRQNPVFSVLFELLEAASSTSATEAARPALCDLEIHIRENPAALVCTFVYADELFDVETIVRLSGHFETLLRGVIARPEQPVSSLPLLTESERHALLQEWNPRSSPLAEACIHDSFERAAERAPDSVAVEFEGERLTYRELNHRSNQLAWHLRKLGVGPDVLVGICLEPSLEMVVSILAVLKSGGGYVPLDPAYPAERLAFMLEDAQTSVLLSNEGLLKSLQVPAGIRICSMDEDAEAIGGEPTRNPTRLGSPENPAYVIYTSGSTGKPKGVLVTHRNVDRLFKATESWFQFDERDVWTLFHSFAFDFSVWELWGALRYGGCLVVVPRLVARSPEAFHALLARSGVTVLSQTPSAFRQLIAQDESSGDSLRLRLVVLGGEALEPGMLRPWFDRHGDESPRLVNMYGITETTVHVTYHPVTRRDLVQPLVSLIGRPIPDLQVYILDRNLQLCPVGVPGELHVAGAGLARGYVNRPELTSARFIPNPFALEPGERLYKTGDLGRFRPDGQIEYFGRVDQQVKIRGYRIEIGEIEEALSRHPDVRSCVIVARQDDSGDKRLFAYVVPSKKASVTELREFLKKTLPEHMMPSGFVFLNSLPLTTNGKIDRLALPVPAPDRPDLNTPFVPPETPLDESLCKICAELLGLEVVGIEDNFFELGGHSLLATQLMSRIRSTFHVEIPLGEFFRSPTIRATAEWISSALRDEPGVRSVLVSRVPRTGNLPLSSSQENVWFLQQLEPGNRAYQIQPTLRFHGRLDVAALKRSLTEIVRRHEIYRTTFPTVAGVPAQRIHEPSAAHLTTVDLQEVAGDVRNDELRRRMDQEIQRTFDLTRLPLVRWTLFRLGPDEHVLLHVEHHLVHDGWSLNVFLRELAALYRAFHEGRPSPLSEPEMQFADYAVFQRRWMETEQAGAQRAYWMEKLAATPAPLEIPSDRPRPAAQTFRGAVRVVELPVDLAEALRALSRREGCTLFMTMLATFATLLYRYSGREDFCIGSGVANRRWLEFEALMGMLVNVVSLRIDLGADPSFTELLRRIRDVTLEGYANQEYPFAAVVEAVQPERRLSHALICQVFFSFHDSPLAELDFGGLQLDLQEFVSNGSAKFDLNVICVPRSEQRIGRKSKAPAGGITLAWEYNTDLFDESTIGRMLGHFETLLRAVVADPERPVSSLPLLTAAEERQIRVEFNDTRTDYPRTRTVAELFEAQAEKTPDAPAVISRNGTLTYADLNRKANQLAHHLGRLGVGAKRMVGVCLDRSPDLIVGLLGILKAGGAYVPIDASYPRERIAFLFSDAALPLVLTQRELVAQLPIDATVQPLCLDSDWAGIARETEENPKGAATADSLAYVIYTSGSTGTPKGVEITHAALANHMFWMQEAFPLVPEDRVLQKTPISFDASVWEFFAPLLAGAQLVVANPDDHRDPASLISSIVAHRVTVLQVVPSLLRMLLDQKDFAKCTSLKRVFCGGEPLTTDLRDRFFDALPAELHNLYGPTEATIDATFWTCRRDDRETSVPIGRTIANMRAYVLDARGGPVPIGVGGELHLGGAGLARGYRNRTDLTAERFIPDPFQPESPGRLYRTGDCVRWRPDGALEYLGRLDHQIKLRGVRIELGEIETALREHPGVRDAVVTSWSDGDSGKRLFAYFVPESSDAPPAGTLRRHLAETLPDYMIPSGFVSLQAIPLTLNGKVDRAALPPPDGRRPEVAPFVPPRTAVEKALADVWKEVLKVDRVGVEDNFFELGGHSLLATVLLNRIARSFNVQIPLREIFEKPTLEGFALTIAEDLAGKERPEVIFEMLEEVRNLSDEEARLLLASEGRTDEDGPPTRS